MQSLENILLLLPGSSNLMSVGPSHCVSWGRRPSHLSVFAPFLLCFDRDGFGYNSFVLQAVPGPFWDQVWC